jgi:hypothetical protein
MQLVSVMRREAKVERSYYLQVVNDPGAAATSAKQPPRS